MTVGTRTLPLTGSGDTTAEAAVDVIAGVDYPLSKLVDGTVDSTTPIKAADGVAANALRVTMASDGAVIGAVNETAPGTDTASSGLNGRLQRIAQRITSLITLLGGGLPSALSSDRLKVEAAAGTNLNTSALALESGGNLAGAATSLAVVDDWDESDRAKVNPIVGQAGLQGGSGAVSANTQRVVLATDVPLPAGANAIGEVTVGGGALEVTNYVGDPIPAIGDVAHGSPDSGFPVKIGGEARSTNPTAVDNGDRVDFIADLKGRQIAVLNQARELTAHQTTTITNSTTETTILTAVASTFLDLTSLIITNVSATACTVTIKDATTGTTRMIIALAANGGAVLNWPVPVTQASTNNNWTATLSVNTVTVHFFVQAVKNT